MKNKSLNIILTLALLACVQPAFAQNTVFTYQGRVLDNGTNFTGTGQFQFALVTSLNANQTATATAIVSPLSPNAVSSFNIINTGSGYVTAPAVTISGGGGSGATATATLGSGTASGTVSGINITSGGSGYTTPPTVTIAPPPPNITYTTYWSNDGTSVNGGEPSAAVGVAVTNGLFTVVLGDTTLANMDGIPASLFAQPNLQLQIWFNDGTSGFAALSPLQNLTPTPYAIQALNATSASNVSGIVSAAQLTGTVPSTSLRGPYSATVNFSDPNSSFNGTFSGNGANLTSLNANNLSSGTVPLARLPASVVTNNETGVTLSGTFNGNISGNGTGVTNVPFAALNGNGYISWGNFVLSSSPGVGSSPDSVIAADVNGDGKPDLISANQLASTLTVLTNNGFGVFGSNATLNVGSYPRCVIATDVNGDGKLDLISANENDNTLTVFTNNGSGVFGSNATLTVGSGPESVIAADVNGDGHVDLISANEGGSLTVLTNNGSGVFGSNATLTVSGTPDSVIATDVNGDGHVDLISGNVGGNTLTVFTNNGSGVFGFNATLTVVGVPISVIAADINGDGKPDLISASQGGSLTVLTNNGFGVFGSNAVLNAAALGSEPTDVIAADVNADGMLDLISANYANNTLTVWTNNGNGVFGFNATLTVSGFPVSVIAADVNGDGRLDLISANSTGNTLSVLLNTPIFDGMVNASQFAPGTGLSIQLNSAGAPDVIGGSQNNFVSSGVEGATIGGGGATNYLGLVNFTNGVTADFGTVGGGANNIAGNFATVGGGLFNNATNQYATVGGGVENIAAGLASVIAGGANNTNQGDYSFVGGGLGNTAIGSWSTVGCGYYNNASGNYATVGGGQDNTASGLDATVGGGYRNNASGNYATVPGGGGNTASGADSFAAGENAQATDNNSFVWGDGSRPGLSQGPNTFTALATGGFWIFSGTYPAGIKLAAGSSSWATLSDRNAKKNFKPVNTETVLDKLAAIPIQQWNYKWEKDSDVPNIGPMAQDFKRAFYPGRDDKSITTLEFDGVELAAIQGLNQKLEEQAKEKDAEIQELKQRLDALEKIVLNQK